jgi:hypothetical protein
VFPSNFTISRMDDLLLSSTDPFISPMNFNIVSQNLLVFPTDVPRSLCIYLPWIFQYFLSISFCLPCISNPASSRISFQFHNISHPRSPCISLGYPCIFFESPCISLGCMCLDFPSSPMNLFVSPIHLNIFSQNLPVFPSDLPRSLCISPGSLYPQSLIFLYLPVSPSTFTISPMDLASQISLKMPRSSSIAYESQYIFSKSPCVSLGSY